MKNSKKEDWNEKVRKSTMHRDPIGSTRASIIRKDRRSLRRHILETANQGLQMDTDVLVRKFHSSQSNRCAFRITNSLKIIFLRI